MIATPDWAGTSGDIWAQRWRDTDRALAPVGKALDAAILAAAPPEAFSALDIGCGPGTTTLALADARPDATILGCDLSQSLIAIARQRAEALPNVRFVELDAEAAARDHGPFALFFSRHGVMFFDDPRRALATLRAAAAPGAKLIFSCFQAWSANPWAADLAAAAAGQPIAPPGREPGGFAFADVEHVRDILNASGWSAAEPAALDFDYVAGEGEAAVADALAFLTSLGPAARVLEAMDGDSRQAGVERMKETIARHERDRRVTFPAAAWLWTAEAR